MPISELENFRRKYPDYGDMSDADLAQKLAAKYPDAYGDLPQKVGTAEPATFTRTAMEPKPLGKAQIASTPLSIAESIKQQYPSFPMPDAGPDLGEALYEMGVKGALPTVGQAGGYALGALTRIPGAPVTLGAAGSGLGEYLNQQLGITEPSTGQIALAVGAPLVMSAVSPTIAAGKRFLGRRLPGAATALREGSVAQAKALPQLLKPATPSEILYDQVRQFDPPIDLSHVKASATLLKNEEANLLSESASPLTANTVKLIDDLITSPQQSTFQRVWTTMKGINAQIAGAKKSGGTEYGALMQLKRGFWSAIDDAGNAAAGPAARQLRAANKAFGQEIAQETTEEIIHRNFGKALEGGELLSSRAAPALNQLDDVLRKDPKLADYFPSGTVNRIRETLQEIANYPVRGAPTGADAGSRNLLSKIATASSIAGALSYATGTSPAIMGPAVLTTGYIGSKMIANALMTPQGTQMLRNMLKATAGQMGAPQWQTLGSFIAAQAAEKQKHDSSAQIKKALKNEDISLQVKQQLAVELGNQQ